jgi:uncharacterized protein
MATGWTSGGKLDMARLCERSAVILSFRTLRSGPKGRAKGRLPALCAALVALVLLLAPATALAVSLKDLPASPPTALVLDSADVLSRAASADIEKQLEAFRAERVEARLITVGRLDYGLSLEALGQELLKQWSGEQADGPATDAPAGGEDALLLVLVDSQTKAAVVLASPRLERQLPPDLLRCTARGARESRGCGRVPPPRSSRGRARRRPTGASSRVPR